MKDIKNLFKLISMVLLFCIILPIFSGFSINAFRAEDAPVGTEDNPYEISSVEDFSRYITEINSDEYNQNYRKAFYKLTNDIILNDIIVTKNENYININYKNKNYRMYNDDSANIYEDNSTDPMASMPNDFVCNQNIITDFSGVIDGNGHCIKGFTLIDQQDLSFIKTMTNATLKNINFEDTLIAVRPNEGRSFVASLIGYMDNSTIQNCNLSGCYMYGSKAGGFVNTLSNNSIISNCTNYANISGNNLIS